MLLVVLVLWYSRESVVDWLLSSAKVAGEGVDSPYLVREVVTHDGTTPDCVHG